jgi:hypothetical protein
MKSKSPPISVYITTTVHVVQVRIFPIANEEQAQAAIAYVTTARS